MKSTPKIIFKNQPREFLHEADKKFNDRRKNLLSYIEKFISSEDLFTGKEIAVEFAHTGVSSLVCFIEAETGKYVLKIPLSIMQSEGEAEFLKVWEAVGVPVPHVFKEGTIGNHTFTLMSFIDAPMLNKVVKSDKVFVDMGKTLKKMHSSVAMGYGHIVKGLPQYKTFKEWLMGEDVQKRIKTVKDNNLLGNEHGSIEVMQNILLDFCKNDTISTYCHFDFGTGNIMATDPLTIIDPFPLLCNGIVDIGRAIQLMSSSKDSDNAIEQLKKGYFPDGVSHPDALQAAIILSACMKFHHWHKVGKTEPMENTRQYLKRTIHLLGK